MKPAKIASPRPADMRLGIPSMAVVIAIIWAYSLSFGAAAVRQKTFSSAEEAVKAAATAAKSNDVKELLAIFGPLGNELLFSGDAIADTQRRAEFFAAYAEKNRLISQGENTILVIGKNDWPFPIPLVKRENGWVFDTAKGKEE